MARAIAPSPVTAARASRCAFTGARSRDQSLRDHRPTRSRARQTACVVTAGRLGLGHRCEHHERADRLPVTTTTSRQRVTGPVSPSVGGPLRRGRVRRALCLLRADGEAAAWSAQRYDDAEELHRRPADGRASSTTGCCARHSAGGLSRWRRRSTGRYVSLRALLEHGYELSLSGSSRAVRHARPTSRAPQRGRPSVAKALEGNAYVQCSTEPRSTGATSTSCRTLSAGAWVIGYDTQASYDYYAGLSSVTHLRRHHAEPPQPRGRYGVPTGAISTQLQSNAKVVRLDTCRGRSPPRRHGPATTRPPSACPVSRPTTAVGTTDATSTS